MACRLVQSSGAVAVQSVGLIADKALLLQLTQGRQRERVFLYSRLGRRRLSNFKSVHQNIMTDVFRENDPKARVINNESPSELLRVERHGRKAFEPRLNTAASIVCRITYEVSKDKVLKKTA